MDLSGGRSEGLMTRVAVLIQYKRVTDRQTDRQTDLYPSHDGRNADARKM